MRHRGMAGRQCLATLVVAATAACATGRGTMHGGATPARATLAHAIDSLLDQPQFRNAFFGALVVDGARGDTLYARNAHRLFMPASNEKILTATAALHLLGPDFRFSTTVATTVAPADGEIHGDLVLLGTGDPSVSDHMRGDAMTVMRAMAESLSARGVVRITGDLVNGLDAFPGATLGFGWAWDDLDETYSAGVDELYLNEGFARVVAHGGRGPGDPAIVTTSPARTYPRVHSSVVTALPDSAANGGRGGRGERVARGRIRVEQDSSDAGAVLVSGAVAPGDSAAVTITFRDQAAAYLSALREALTERGIAVDGVVRSRPPAPGTSALPGDPATDTTAADMASPPWPLPPGQAYPLFSIVSPPLRDILPPFLKPSQNQIAEILLRTLGRAITGVGRADSGAAVVRRQLLEWGADSGGFVMRDGSGLSRHDVVTPATIVRVLSAIRADTAFRLFYDALPIAGVDGTLETRMRGTPAQGNVHAKTGSLDMVRSLSGYVTTADGRELVFSLLSNEWTVPPGAVTGMFDTIAARLAALHLERR